MRPVGPIIHSAAILAAHVVPEITGNSIARNRHHELNGSVIQRTSTHTSHNYKFSSGRGGIRTHGDLSATPVFKTGAFDHSATLPVAWTSYRCTVFAEIAYP